MLKNRQFSSYTIVVLLTLSSSLFSQTSTNELNAFWIEAERQVREGDFEAYSNSFHYDAILVNGISKTVSRLKRH